MFFIILLIVSLIIVFLYFALCSRPSDSAASHYSHDKDRHSETSSSHTQLQTNPIKTSIEPTVSVTKTVVYRELPPIDYSNKVNRYCEYKVTGKNPATNRIKGDFVVAKINAEESEIILKTYLLPPYDIERIHNPPTASQLSYATDLELDIPKKATSSDVSCLISRCHEDRGADFVSSELIDYAAENNVLISPFSSVIRAVCRILSYLDDKDSLAFWIYMIFCIQKGMPIGNLSLLSNKDVFYGLSNNSKYDDLINLLSSQTREKIEYLFKHKRILCQGSHRNVELSNIIYDYISENIL